MFQRFSPITLGEHLKSVEAGGFVLTETTHQPNRTLPRHYHEHANIAFVLSGSFTEILDRRRIECSLHSLLIKPAGEAHANQYGRTGMHCLLLEVQHQRLASLYPLSQVLNRVDHVRGGSLSLLAMRIYREFHIMDSASALAIEGLMLELIAGLSRRSTLVMGCKPPRWLGRVKDMLHACFFDSLSLADTAKAAGVHPVHLAREFRRFYGCTLGEYIRQLRIEAAVRQLSETDLPLVEIALAVGFTHQSHFSRLFKRHTGMTPSEFRTLHHSR